MRVKRYEDFVTEEIGLRNALIGGALGVSSIMQSHASEPVKPAVVKDTISNTAESTQAGVVNDFIDSLRHDVPNLFIDRPMTDRSEVNFGQYERISFLKRKVQDYEQETGLRIDMNMITRNPHHFPFTINYFFVRGLDNLETGPTRIRMMKIEYTDAVRLAGHEVFFNFTSIQDANALGVRVNL